MKNLSIKSILALSILILTVGLFSGIGISIFSDHLTEQAYAVQSNQVTPQGDKVYRLAGAMRELIDPMTYTNGDIVMFDVQDMPEITIHNWNNLSAVNRAQIQSQAITDNWLDVTCIVSICV